MSIPKMAEKGIVLPPLWCASICRNAMNEVCVENCAIKRDCSAFEPAKDLKLADMPRVPNTANMTREEKFTTVIIYLSKIVDHLKGEPDEYIPFRRPHTYSASSRHLSPVVQVKDLLPHLTQAISSFEAGKECEDQGIGSETMAQPAD